MGLTRRKLNTAPILRAAIAAQTASNPATLSTSQLYQYIYNELEMLGSDLEGQATRNAFGIATESNPGQLTLRRLQFARHHGRHADTIETYENRGIAQLAEKLLGTQPSPLQASSHSPTVGTPPQTQIDTRIAQSMVISGLASLYSLGSHAPEILRLFNEAQPPHREATVDIVFLPDQRGAGWFQCKVRFAFQTETSQYRIAITTSAYDQEILMASGIVDDVIKLNDARDYDMEVAFILEQSRFVIHPSSSHVQHTLEFNEIAPAVRRNMLATAWQINPDECRIIEVQIPPEFQNSDTSYEHHWTFGARTDTERYAFWSAPRLTYLRNISIDTSRFPQREKWKFMVQPFLGPVFPGAIEPTGDRYVLAANSWVVQGHGVAVIWQEK